MAGVLSPEGGKCEKAGQTEILLGQFSFSFSKSSRANIGGDSEILSRISANKADFIG